MVTVFKIKDVIKRKNKRIIDFGLFYPCYLYNILTKQTFCRIHYLDVAFWTRSTMLEGKCFKAYFLQ